MKRKYCCEASRGALSDYYVNQAGSGLPIFQGSRGQRGHGFGSVLGGLFRSALPMLKRVGGQVLRGAARVVSDVAAGKNFGDAARSRLSSGINEFLDGPGDTTQTGSGRRRTYAKRKRIARQRLQPQSSRIKRRKIVRRGAKDIFD